MKLEKLFEQNHDISSLTYLPDEYKSKITDFLDKVSKGFKPAGVEKINETRSKFDFSNSLLDISVLLNASVQQGKQAWPWIWAHVKVRVAEAFLINPQDDFGRILIDTELLEFSNIEVLDNQDSLIDSFHARINEFVDWYMDVSGEYGKVKLFNTTYNVIEEYSSSGKHRFIAIAGDFQSPRDINHDPAKPEKRVF
jgi:hypothetical protein